MIGNRNGLNVSSSFSSTFSCLKLFLPCPSNSLLNPVHFLGTKHSVRISPARQCLCLTPTLRCACLLTPQHVSKSHALLSAKRAVVSSPMGSCARVRLCPMTFHTIPESEEEHNLLLSKKKAQEFRSFPCFCLG